jgi:hypothetical protein
MNSECKELLRNIGRRLDQSIFPRVKNGGFVLPSESIIPFQSMGTEICNESQRQRRSETAPRPGFIGRPWPSNGPGITGRTWSAGNAAPVIGPSAPSPQNSELDAVRKAYPGTRYWDQGENYWLSVESALLPDLDRKARFLILVSDTYQTVKSWGFWDRCAIGTTWIGPRHTNFPDGSICAFDPRDGTWKFGDSLVALLDIYTVWAFRHLHLEVLGRWPGPQSVEQPYERMLELRDDELCGCGKLGKRYAECCKPADLKRNLITEAVSFGFFSAWSERNPPPSVVQFTLTGTQPPPISYIFRSISM